MGNELVKYEKSLPPDVPEDWDFSQADTDFDEHIKGWRRLSEDVISTLWVFYNKLKVGHNPEKSRSENSVLPTWLEWLESKGISDKTPINHFKVRGWLPDDSPKQIVSSSYRITEKNLAVLIEKIENIVAKLNVKSNNALPGNWLRHEVAEVLNVMCELRTKPKKLKGKTHE